VYQKNRHLERDKVRYGRQFTPKCKNWDYRTLTGVRAITGVISPKFPKTPQKKNGKYEE